LNPETSDDLFFVANGTGGHVFSATIGEHEQNVAKWRHIENPSRPVPQPAPRRELSKPHRRR